MCCSKGADFVGGLIRVMKGARFILSMVRKRAVGVRWLARLWIRAVASGLRFWPFITFGTFLSTLGALTSF